MSEPSDNPDYRLPAGLRPSRYELLLRPDLERWRFTGEVAIEIEADEPAAEIILNAAELEIEAATLHPGAGGEPLGLAWRLDERLERLHLTVEGGVEAGRHRLVVDFAGTINDKLRGLYRSGYLDGDGVRRELATTQLQSTDARRMFPCFDEPAMKAVFSLAVEVPDGLVAVSNYPEIERHELGGGRSLVRFADTMAMSTYLLALVVGPLEVTETVVADGVPLRVVTPVGKVGLTAFALEAATHALEYFHDYFALPYPAAKLDLVAVPDFAQGAMENLGCVIFREQDLLCDPAASSIPELNRIAEVVSHEIAHMWFGDLVTMRWWNSIWLNEAFATFMATCCVDHFRPEWQRFVTFGTEKDLALGIDGLHATRPIEFPVHAPDECEAMFDHLTYLKGGNVLRMVEQYLGADRFRDGVRLYLRRHAYANTETSDLFDAIEEVAGAEPVRAICDSWIFQGGHPLVTAALEGDELVVSQSPFAFLPDDERPAGSPPSAIGHDWFVPVSVATDGGERRTALLGPAPDGLAEWRLPAGTGPVVVNAGGSGVYRVRYDHELFGRIVATIDRLSALERFNLVADTWACVRAGLVDAGDLLTLARALDDERDPNVWSVVASAATLFDALSPEADRPALRATVREVAGPCLAALGFEPRAADTAEEERTRSALISLLGLVGEDAGVRESALAAFAAVQAGESELPPSTAAAILGVVVRAGGDAQFEAVLAGYRQPTDPLSATRHLFALTRTADPARTAELLEMCLTEVRPGDTFLFLRALVASRLTGPAAFDFVLEHFDELAARLPSFAMPTVLGGMTSLVALDAEGRAPVLERATAFVAGRDFGGHRILVDQALEQLAVNVRLARRVGPVLGARLASR